MPAASTSVKYFHSAMVGAPVCTNVAGSLIAVLDLCLKDGFNLKTVESIVVSNGIATASMSTGVGAFEADAVALIAGASPAGLNGEKRIISATTNTITFDAEGISNQTATGTITAKMAPAGWEKPFSGTNLAAYRSADVTSTRAFLRVDDTPVTSARVVGYESMTDINSGTGPFPTPAQVSGGMFILKPFEAFKGWTVIADSKTFYIHLESGNRSDVINMSGHTSSFGDFTPNKSGDMYSCSLQASNGDNSGNVYNAVSDLSYMTLDAVSHRSTPRSFTGVGSAVNLGRLAESYFTTSNTFSGTVNYVAVYPNGPDNGLLLSNMLLVEAGPHLRGRMRGPLALAQSVIGNFSHREKLVGSGSLSGRKLMMVRGAAPWRAWNTGSATSSMTAIDITGPWG